MCACVSIVFGRKMSQFFFSSPGLHWEFMGKSASETGRKEGLCLPSMPCCWGYGSREQGPTGMEV